ncbi:MAG: GDSL-type esterase/lipase family protein [Candidatus Pedobacter colombiensis]|uniref:GDSL-type esterase/lipase family protein n=1 Tax=Candidatus Pedobacter colombiensis TaxID=3121371 RepID=A0AAJ5W6U1_9SPHI|nr:GDSL-type esterase/lipase family protein [Pedobacter sp.]WEK17622.1 MAG: GDSL-type esterase/lipase family protein [Pedobacter sp.]
MKYIFKLTLFWGLFFIVGHSFAQSKIRITCIGNSITFGSGLTNRAQESYPAQLQALLGAGYEVLNFGVSGATMLKKGNKPYWNTPEYQKALLSNPNLVFIKLGTNDSKVVNRPMMGDFEQDYHDMIRSFRELPSHPRVVLLLPVKAFSDEKFGISGTYLKETMIPMIQKVAYDEKLAILDLYSLFADKEELLADKIHPNAVGAGFIASRLYDFIKLQTEPVEAEGKGIIKHAEKSNFYGYNCFSFDFKGHKAKIVAPKATAKDMPWIWRARFWGHEPQTDIALLERGFYVVYCDVAELFGNAEAIGVWNDFYNQLQKMGFAKKAVLEGMSRGGVYVYNWAAVNPSKVACVYADNPVLDLKSWPGGKGVGPGSKKDWDIFLKDYGYVTEEQAAGFAGSPIDKIKEIVKGKYPMLHVCSDMDELVPMSENTLPFAEKIKQAGGNITIIHKPEGKHHPHSLPNPAPIVDFILKSRN